MCVSRGGSNGPTAVAGGVQAFHHEPCEAAIEQTVSRPSGRTVGGLVCQNSIIYRLRKLCRVKEARILPLSIAVAANSSQNRVPNFETFFQKSTVEWFFGVT